jgi:hypothetical protein
MVSAYQDIERLSKTGKSEDLYAIGDMFYHGTNVSQSYEEAAKWFRLAAEQGNTDAQYMLGTLYDGGLGVKQSCEEALKWYNLSSSDLKNISVEDEFYTIENICNGVDESYSKPAPWYILAAE